MGTAILSHTALLRKPWELVSVPSIAPCCVIKLPDQHSSMMVVVEVAVAVPFLSFSAAECMLHLPAGLFNATCVREGVCARPARIEDQRGRMCGEKAYGQAGGREIESISVGMGMGMGGIRVVSGYDRSGPGLNCPAVRCTW